MTVTILEPNQNCRPHLFIWYFHVPSVKRPFWMEQGTVTLIKGFEKNGGIKVTGMN